MDWGLSNRRGLSRAMLFSPASRSTRRTNRAYWDVPFGKVQTRKPVPMSVELFRKKLQNGTLPTKLTSSYLKILDLSKMLLDTAQLQPWQLPSPSLKALWSPRKSLTPSFATSQWYLETSPKQRGPQPQESVRKKPAILVHVPINRKMPARRDNANFFSGSGEGSRTPVRITYKAWCEKQFRWPEVSGHYPYMQAFQVLAACDAHLGNNHFIALNCHGQLSRLSVAIRLE